MKTLGLIGGLSWESTAVYYRQLNEGVRARLGGLHSARLLIDSLDFGAVAALQHAGDWATLGRQLVASAQRLEAAGADAIVIASNTMHKPAPEVAAALHVPLLHIADPTAIAVRDAGIGRVGLLGTRFTMEDAFYRDHLVDRHGLDVIVPDAAERADVHRIIYEELCAGVIAETSRNHFRAIVEELIDRGAGGIVLGCTEIALLLKPADAAVPLFDSAALHVEAALDFMLTA